MKYLLLLIFVMLAACAKDNSTAAPSGSATPAAPTPAPAQEEISTWCGDTIQTVNGVAYEISNNPVTVVSDGIYGYPGGTDFWGATTPACWFQVVDGVPSASNGPGGRNL